MLLSVFSISTLMALRLSQGGPIPVEVTARYHKADPTFADCLTFGSQHPWRARYLMNSAAKLGCEQLLRETSELLLTGLPFAA